jgi:TonB dependent receptor/TonB-dependent Receptor Plug Domain
MKIKIFNMVLRTATLLLLCAGLQAQPKQVVVSGYLRDESGEALPGATLTPVGESGVAQSNAFGFFNISAPPSDSFRLAISFAGYQNIFHLGRLHRDTSVELVTQVANTLKTIEIDGGRKGASFSVLSPLGVKQFTAKQLSRVTAVGGEADILKALALTPGVSQGAEGSAGIFVRGGSPDQNLILIDGSPVYNVSHLFGFLSVFNSDAIQSVDLITGGFPARFGGRLSSVIDVHMREGNPQRFHGKIHLGLIASRLMLEGPVVKGRSSFIVSGRTSNIGLITLPARRAFKDPSNRSADYNRYYFNDLNIKYNHTLNNKNRVFFSLYTGNDAFQYRNREPESEEKNNLSWGNATATLRHTLQCSDRAFVKNSLGWSRFNYDIRNEAYARSDSGAQLVSLLQNTSYLEDFSARSELEYSLNSRHFLRAGIEGTYHVTQPQLTRLTVSDTEIASPNTTVFSTELSAYAEDEWQIGPALTAAVGFRYNTFITSNKQYASLQPRLSLRYLLSKTLALKAGYGHMQQNLHLLSNNGIGLPNDIWVPATDRVAPQRARQFTLCLVKEFPSRGFNASFETYYKKMADQIDFAEGIEFLFELERGWEDVVENGGTGRAYGAEIFVQKTRGRLTGMASYALARAERRFANINSSVWYPFKYDRRHEVELSGAFALTPKWELAFNWVFQTGHAVTLPTGRYQGPGHDPGIVITYTTRNGARLPAYHRADIGLTHTKKNRWQGETVWGLQVYNVYNRQNPYFFVLSEEKSIDANGMNVGKPVLRKRSLLPVLPSVTWSLSF